MKEAWFGPRKFGWGVSPRNGKGWLATLVFALVVIATLRFVVPDLAHYFGLARPLVSGVALAAETAIFLLLIRGKFDPNT